MNDYEFGSKKLLKLKWRRGDQNNLDFEQNLMNDGGFVSINFLKLKWSSGDKTIQTFCKIGSLEK